MSGSNVLFLMTGSIACYKACHVVSRLVQAGHRVQVVASPSALRFVGGATLEGLTGRPVLSDLWEKGRAMDHIHLVRESDLILAAPASAHFLNRIALGVGDDLLTTLFLAHDFKKPFLVAPAMNTTMYLHPATQASLKLLREMGVRILEAASGVLACGETGYGKLLDPDLILEEVRKELGTSGKKAPPPGSESRPTNSESPASGMAGQQTRVLITAGGTSEAVDDVRVLTNSSTGRSGARLADFLVGLGYDVTLARAKSAARPESTDVRERTFVSFADLEHLLRDELATGTYTHVVQMAAISDYTVAGLRVDGRDVAPGGKTPSGHDVELRLKPTAKLIARLAEWSPSPLRIAGFKLTSHATADERDHAVSRVLAHAELVVQNDVAEITEHAHPYRITTRGTSAGDRNTRSLAGFAEMSDALASWIAEARKETK